VLPLSGVVVLDVTRCARGRPVRGNSGLGADVIRVEPPVSMGRCRRPAQRPGFRTSIATSARSTLTLKSGRGHAVFAKLAKRADVLVENMPAAVKAA